MEVLSEWADTVGEDERARQIEAVREELMWPKDARAQDPTGEWVWVKPPLKVPENLEVIFLRDPLFCEHLYRDDFTGRVLFHGREVVDTMLTEIRLSISRTYKVRYSIAQVHELLNYAAEKLARHPVREYLEALRWDGVPRISRLLTDYAGVEHSDLTATISRRFLISCVARIMQPGCKVDTVLILAGPQGYGKSTWFSALAGDEWFKDDPIDIRSKDAKMALRGVWIYEMAELSSMKPRDAETVKAFLSQKTDRFRPPYGRTEIEQPRQCVFVGTTNEPSFLNDPTGARRFWPAEVTRMPDIARTVADRDQLWAEAVEAYRGRERWWLELNESDALTEAQEQYQHVDPWQAHIESYINSAPPSPDGWTVEQLLGGALDKDKDKQSKADEMRIGGILTRLGFVKRRIQVNGKRRWRWLPG